MRYNDLIQLYFERSGALQAYWTLYVVVVGALLAFSSLRKIPDRLTTILVSLLFAVFAYQNLGGLHDAAVQRSAALTMIAQMDSANTAITATEATRLMRTMFEPTMIPATYANIRNFHLASDILTFAAIWAMELRRKRASSATE